MKFHSAVELLRKFFSINTEILSGNHIPEADVIAWAEQIKAEGDKYQLTWRQHHFLTGYSWQT